MFSDIKRISHSFFLRPMKRDHCWPHKKAVESDFVVTVSRFAIFLPGLSCGKTLGIVFFAMVAHALGFLLPVGGVCFVYLCILCLRSCTEATRL